MRHVRHDTDLNCVKNVLGNWVSGLPKCGKVKFVCLFVCFHQYYSLLEHFSSLTTTASWCFPSKGKNSLKHTSNPPELTFSNHKYIASFGFVLRVYLTETNTRGLEAKLCKKNVTYMKKYRLKTKQASRDEDFFSANFDKFNAKNEKKVATNPED